MPKQTVLCDEKGRLVLPKSVRERYGCEFHIVPAVGEVVLVPISKNPLAELARMGKTLKKKPIPRLKNELRKQTMDEL